MIKNHKKGVAWHEKMLYTIPCDRKEGQKRRSCDMISPRNRGTVGRTDWEEPEK